MKRKSDLSVLRDLLDVAVNRIHLAIHMGLARPLIPPNYWRHGGGKRQGIIEAWRLKQLHDHDDGVHDRINRNFPIVQRIAECSRDGMIGIVESGRDCDCVDYVHPCQPIKANLMAYLALLRHKSEWADGPFVLSIVPPEEAEKTPHESHDRVLEAFEEGRPHHVISTYHGG